MTVASKPNGDQLRRSVEEKTKDNSTPVHRVPSDSTPLARLNKRFACVDSINTLCDSYSREKRSSNKELNLERCKLEEEFKKIYSCPQTTLEQLNTIHSKWLLHQYKRVHRFRALGGDNCESYYYKSLKCQYQNIGVDYQNWVNTLAAFSIINDVTIIIDRSDIKDVQIYDSLRTDTDSFDEQVEWIEGKARATFSLLRRRA